MHVYLLRYRESADFFQEFSVVLKYFRKHTLRRHPENLEGAGHTDHLFNAIDEKVTAMVFIDLSKAFDSICHTTLLHKLQALGTPTKVLNWFQSWFQIGFK